MKKFLPLLMPSLLAFQSQAQSLSAGNYTSYQLAGPVLRINTDKGMLTLREFSADIIQVNFFPDNTEAYDSSVSVVLVPSGSFTVSERTDGLDVGTGSTTLSISKNPVRITLTSQGKIKFSERSGLRYQDNKWAADFTVGNDAFYGMGSRAMPLNLKGDSFYMYNKAIYAFEMGEPVLSFNIPFLLSDKMYGIWFENITPGQIRLAIGDSVLSYSSDSLRLSYFILNGNSWDELISSYTLLTGRQPLPPRWISGYLQSKFGYRSEADARAIVQKMRGNNFPMDALILDLYWYGYLSVMGNLDWDHANWPNSTGMMRDFLDKGIRTVLITEPYFTTGSSNFAGYSAAGYFARTGSGQSYVIPDYWTGAAALLDMYNPDARSAFWNTYKTHTDEGVGGWWCDLGEPDVHPGDMFHINGRSIIGHNTYSLTWASMLYGHFRQDYPQQRVFHLFRSGYAGSQRYGVIPWSGDVNRSWSGLSSQIPMMVSSGLSGLAYMHGDAGGFAGFTQDDELYTRWLQYAAFTPVMRAHGYDYVPTEPVNFSAQTQEIVRNFINLRYSLLPYNYTLMYENTLTGRPLARPMFYYDTSSLVRNMYDQYYWGKDMIVAPVMGSRQVQRSVYAPPGKWYDYFNGRWISGGGRNTVQAPIQDIPLLIRGNAFIPFLKPRLSTDSMRGDSVYITYFNANTAAPSSDIMYEDDPSERDPLSTGKYSLISFHSQGFQPSDELVLELADSIKGAWAGRPSSRFMEFTVTDIGKLYNIVSVNGHPLKAIYTRAGFNSTDSSYYYDIDKKRILLHFKWDNASATAIRIAYDPAAASSLAGLSPNPTHSDVYMPLDIAAEGNYVFSLYDMQGRKVQTLATRTLPAGSTIVYLKLPGGTISPGIYYIRVTGNSWKKTFRLLIL